MFANSVRRAATDGGSQVTYSLLKANFQAYSASEVGAIWQRAVGGWIEKWLHDEAGKEPWKDLPGWLEHLGEFVKSWCIVDRDELAREFSNASDTAKYAAFKTTREE